MKIFSFILLLFFCTSLSAYPQHSPQLSPYIKKLCQFEETKRLLSSVEATGAITIKASNLGAYASNAAWFPDERTICINFSKKRSEGSVICSLVFEFHNALNQHLFDSLDRQVIEGKISKKKYVESVEQLEYANALKTAEVLNRGVRQGFFPHDAHYSVAPTFKEHFEIQQQAGHSQFIANLWESLSRSKKSSSSACRS